METNKTVTTVDNNKGENISVAGDTYRILISGEQTNKNYAVIDMLVPPNGGPGPHSHKDIQEMFYIVEGEIEFKTEEENYKAEKGAFVNIPLGGAVHSFKNKTNSVAHLLCTVVPAGLDEFFKKIGKPVEAGTFLPQQKPGKEEEEKMKSIAEKYGQTLYPPDYLD